MIQMMDLPAYVFELVVVVGFKCRRALTLELTDPGLECRLVDAHHRMMLVGIDAERPAQRRKEPVLVHLRVALHVVFVHVLGDVAQFGDGLALQVLVSVRHTVPPRQILAGWHRGEPRALEKQQAPARRRLWRRRQRVGGSWGKPAGTKKPDARIRIGLRQILPAVTYSPTHLRTQYHRR